MGCCVGGLAKPQSLPERTPMASKKINIGHFSAHKKSQWSSSPEAMENNISISHSLETNFSLAPNAANESMMLPEENPNNLFTNQVSLPDFEVAAIAWNEMRREWVGDQSKRSHMAPREPTISWSTTYEDLVSATQPFPQPIPLSEMVDFLVDVWHEEGLYD